MPNIAVHSLPPGRTAPTLEFHNDYWVGRFQAMASPCEILLDGVTEEQAQQLLLVAATEAWRIEQKYSRYVAGNLIDRLHHSHGQPLWVDAETARLLDYAAQCHQLSEGRFDITSGVLRKAWRFDGSDRLPTPAAVAALLPRIGWEKLSWQAPWLSLPEGMEIDLGGIGKEYAVDRTLQLLLHTLANQHGQASPANPYSMLVNFGGDLMCSGPRPGGSGWRVGIEQAQPQVASRSGAAAAGALQLRGGAIATSGDSRRYLLRNGVRYGHILDPRSGWPVPDAPHSVTVAAATCTLAGMLATFAMLQGPAAESFLAQQGVRFWVQRD